MGRRRRRRRHRLDRALPLLRVEAALPVRDHGEDGRRLSASASTGSSPSTTTGTRRSSRCSSTRSTSPSSRCCSQRVMVAEFGRIGVPRSLPREEAARASARAQTRDLEFAWGTFLARGMQQGLHPGERPAAPDTRGARPLQQRLALVPARRDAHARRASAGSSSAASSRSSAARPTSPPSKFAAAA